MTYAIVVSNFPVDVGIPAIIQLDDERLPVLNLAIQGTTAVSDLDTCITTESSTSVRASTTSDSSVENDSAVISVALSNSDASVGSEVIPRISVSSSDTSTESDNNGSIAISIPVLDNAVGAESSALNVITADSIVGSDTSSLLLFPSDTDHSSFSETQSVSTSLVSTDDSVTTTDVQLATLNFISSDSVQVTETNGSIAEAALDADSSHAAEQISFSANVISAEFMAISESISISVQVSSTDTSLTHDDQPFFFSDSDSCTTQDVAIFSVDQRDVDSCSLSENNFFSLQSSLLIEWGVFPHLNQVVFAQSINQ